MDIFTVNLKPKVLEYNNGEVKIFVDYPNISQGQELNRLRLSEMKFDFDIKWEQKENSFTPKLDELDNSQMLKIIETSESVAFKEKCLRIKYCIKGWEGIKDESDNPYPCKIESGALSEETLETIIRSEWIDKVYEDIKALLRFDGTDKKKFI